ncbi:hypothetical protein HDU86_002812 [Geranomyces michiganensis]|nr:hypothetical protein HDU86_002812 [Geranomyces michiganensis]
MWRPYQRRKQTPSDKKWERKRAKWAKESAERERVIAAREERGTFRAEQVGAGGNADATVKSRAYAKPHAVSTAALRPLAELLEMSLFPPSLTQFCALTVVRNQKQVTTLAGVPWDNGGEHIVDILYAVESSPSRALLGALMEEYPEFRAQNSTLVLRGGSFHPQQSCLQRLTDPDPCAPFPQFLTRLDLGFTNLTADMARALSVLEALVVLDVRGTTLDDDAVINLLRPTTYPLGVPALRKLSHLSLEYCNVTHACAPYLLRTPALVAVDLSNTDVDIDEDAWRDWTQLPDDVPLFAYQHAIELPEDVCAALLASSSSSSAMLSISPHALHERLTRAWRPRQLAQSDMRNEAWHYVKDIGLCCALEPGEIDDASRATTTTTTKQRGYNNNHILRLVKIRDSHVGGVAPRKSVAEQDEMRMPVRKRVCAAPRDAGGWRWQGSKTATTGACGAAAAAAAGAVASLDTFAKLLADGGGGSANPAININPSGQAHKQTRQQQQPAAATVKSFATLFRSSSSKTAAIDNNNDALQGTQRRRQEGGTPMATPSLTPAPSPLLIARTVPQGILRLASSSSSATADKNTFPPHAAARKFPAAFLKRGQQ